MAARRQASPTHAPPTVTRDIDLTVDAAGNRSADAAGDVQATISVAGDLSGQVAVGSNIVQMQIGTMYGNVLTTAPAAAAPTVTPRPRPVRLLPRAPSAFLDRTDETGRVIAALLAREAVSVTGPPGVGKSTLLRSVAHHPQLETMPAGVVHLSAFDETPADLAQSLFDAFYETANPYKPSKGELRQRFHDLDAAVLLDDVTWSDDGVGRAVDLTPSAGIALASERPVVVAAEVRLLDLPAGAARPAVGELDVEERRALAALVAVPGLALDYGQLSAAVGIRDPERVLTRLVDQGLVLQRAGRVGRPDRYAAAPGAGHVLTDDEVPSSRGILEEFFLAWAARHRHTVRVGPNEADAAVAAMRDAARRGRWPLVIALGRAVESSLALAGRWDAWRETLERLTAAAEQLEATDVRAFALHQRGSLAACTGDVQAATTLLQEALQLREVIGDVAGAGVTRANLRILTPAPTPPPPEPPPPASPPPPPWAWILLGTVAAVGVVVAGLFAVGVLPAGVLTVDPPPVALVSVPFVVDEPLEDAVSILDAAGLSAETVTVESADVVPGTVVDQVPGAGEEVERGSVVRLSVATDGVGPPPVEPPPVALVSVPFVVDEPLEDAVSILDAAGLSAETVTVESADVVPGTVVDQVPGAGEEVEPDSIVTLTVAQLPPVTVPSIVGRSVQEAVRIVVAEGLESGDVIEAEEGSPASEALEVAFLDAGTVIGQRPAAGTEAVAGSPVDMVALARDSVIVPPVEGLTLREADAALAERQLEVALDVLSEDGSACSVVSQDPGAGTIVPLGHLIELQVTPRCILR